MARDPLTIIATRGNVAAQIAAAIPAALANSANHWTGGVIATLYGGTGFSTYATGDILFGTSTSLAKLAGNLTASRMYLSMVSGAPSWQTITLPTPGGNVTSIQFNGTGNTFSGSDSLQWDGTYLLTNELKGFDGAAGEPGANGTRLAILGGTGGTSITADGGNGGDLWLQGGNKGTGNTSNAVDGKVIIKCGQNTLVTIAMTGSTYTGGETHSGSETHTGAVTLSGNVFLSGNSTSSGAMNVSGNLTLSGNSTMSGSMNATGNLQITGSSSTWKGGAVIRGALTLAAATDSFSVANYNEIYLSTSAGFTLGTISGGTDGQSVFIRAKNTSGGDVTMTYSGSIRTDDASTTLTLKAGKTHYLGLKYNSAATKYDLLAPPSATGY